MNKSSWLPTCHNKVNCTVKKSNSIWKVNCMASKNQIPSKKLTNLITAYNKVNCTVKKSNSIWKVNKLITVTTKLIAPPKYQILSEKLTIWLLITTKWIALSKNKIPSEKLTIWLLLLNYEKLTLKIAHLKKLTLQ